EILFGKTDAINQHISTAKLSKIGFIIVVSLLAIISIYLFFRLNRQKALLYFSFVMFMLIIMVLTDYDQLLLLDLPIDYNITVKIVRLSYVFLSLFLFLFIKQFLPVNTTIGWYRLYPYINLI